MTLKVHVFNMSRQILYSQADKGHAFLIVGFEGQQKNEHIENFLITFGCP